MKWKNKGHEFDVLGEKLKSLTAVYFFGAGLMGYAAFEKYRNKITVKGFIDNDARKQAHNFCGLNVYAPGRIGLLDKEAIVVTATPIAYTTILSQLSEFGYVDNENVFSAHMFFPVFDMYRFDELCLPSISFLPTTVCNLKCKCCLNFSPYIDKHEMRALEDLKGELDLLFAKVDTILTLHISGGEPLLYPCLSELVSYIHSKFAQQLGQLELTTNGTIIPKDELCEAMLDADMHITVDDYRLAVPQYVGVYDEVLAKLQSFGISYHVQKAEQWIDLAPISTDNSHFSDEELCDYFNACSVPWQEYRDGRLWLCNYAAYAAIAGIQSACENETFDISKLNRDDKKSLMEFRLGYSVNGYTDFCKRCRSYGNNDTYVVPAEQLLMTGEAEG